MLIVVLKNFFSNKLNTDILINLSEILNTHNQNLKKNGKLKRVQN